DEEAHLKSVAVLKSLFKAATGHLNRGQRSRGRTRAGGLRDRGPRGPVRHQDYGESNRIRVAHRVGPSGIRTGQRARPRRIVAELPDPEAGSLRVQLEVVG